MSKQLRIWLFVLLGTLLASSSLLAEGVITMTTTKAVGETIGLRIEANGDVTIEGVKESAQKNGYNNDYTLTSQTITIRGDVTTLYCGGNQLTRLDVSACTALTTLSCGYNQLRSLDLSGYTSLKAINCRYNDLTSLNVSGCTALTTLDCQSSTLMKLDASGCSNLTMLQYYGLRKVNLSGCKSLKSFSYKGTLFDKLTSLDVSGCTAMTELYCSNNALTSLDVSSCTALTELNCGGNQLTSLDVSGCTVLTKLDCYDNNLTSLNVSGCTALTELNCSVWANFVNVSKLTSLDVSSCTALTKLWCRQVQLTSLDVSKNTALTTLDCSQNQLTSLDVSKNTALTTLDCASNLLRELNISGCNNLNSLECYGNQIKGTEMANLVNSLPDRQGKEVGSFRVLNEYYSVDGNVCLAAHVATAKAKNWRTLFYRNSEWLDYAGLDNPTFAVTYSSSRGGSIIITGADDLRNVPYGTELTVTETNVAEGYKLTTLTANGQDILQTKRFKVTENTRVEATFTLQTYNVTTIKLGEGTLYVSGADDLEAVTLGTELTVTATPAEGYELTELTANNKNILDTKKVVVNEDLIIKAIFSKKTFKVSLEPRGKGTIKAVGADDLNAVPYGTELTIVATPDEGSELTSLIAGGINITETKKVTIKKETTIEAVFTTLSFAVKLTKEGEGALSATGADDLDAVDYGTELTIEATPATGYELVSLEANGVDITATKKVVVTDNLTVKATFTKKSFAVSLTKEGEGTITATGVDDLNAVDYGTELTINATPAEGYELTELTANGRNILDSKKVVVNEDLIIKAIFSQKTFKVSLTKHGNGTTRAIGADDLDAVPYGTELTIEATPATGYELTALTANGRDILSTKRFVVKGDTEVKATFTQKARNYTVTFTQTGEGRVTATGADDLNAVPYGTELTIVATPKQGYELTALTANDKDILATKKVVVTENTTIKATFAKKTFVVTLDKEGEGVLDATGAKDLKAVPYGTKLTITATPAEGYELKALLANGFDIRSTKSVEVTGDTRIKAIFTQQTFAVTLTSNEHGKVKIVEPVDLEAVPYGTTLTISATPAEGYELTALTANGEDILATKSFVVKGATEIRAAFSMAHFAVTLTHEGEGKVDATGAEDLTTVPYGTELTIVATPKQGYELTALTANDKDILATKKVVVTEDLTVKATFAKETFVVTLDKEGEGVLDATGADNLKAVPYGTKLTITATPAEGYELKALLADGFDIRSTKSVEVTGDMRIKAIFTQQTFEVTLTSNEHGKITIAEPVDLKVVPYGTKLTVKATGKNAQCVLTALTANGEDILATQSFVVKGATEVKATFVDHTGVETTVTQQTQLYPNPATDYVIVEGVVPASEVTLHSMTGERLYAGRADSRGTLRIDLTPYADGVYLVCVADETYRVVVRH